MFPALAGGFPSTAPPGKSYWAVLILFVAFWISSVPLFWILYQIDCSVLGLWAQLLKNCWYLLMMALFPRLLKFFVFLYCCFSVWSLFTGYLWWGTVLWCCFSRDPRFLRGRLAPLSSFPGVEFLVLFPFVLITQHAGCRKPLFCLPEGGTVASVCLILICPWTLVHLSESIQITYLTYSHCHTWEHTGGAGCRVEGRD